MNLSDKIWISALVLLLLATGLLGWSIYGPALYQDLLTSYSLCF